VAASGEAAASAVEAKEGADKVKSTVHNQAKWNKAKLMKAQKAVGAKMAKVETDRKREDEERAANRKREDEEIAARRTREDEEYVAIDEELCAEMAVAAAELVVAELASDVDLEKDPKKKAVLQGQLASAQADLDKAIAASPKKPLRPTALVNGQGCQVPLTNDFEADSRVGSAEGLAEAAPPSPPSTSTGQRKQLLESLTPVPPPDSTKTLATKLLTPLQGGQPSAAKPPPPTPVSPDQENSSPVNC
jgi:hypothetical protein